MKFIKSFISTFIVFIATISSSFAQSITANQTTAILKTAKIKVKGITCSKDLKLISTNIEKLKGVSICEVGKQGTTSIFLVKYNPTLLAETEIFAAIENTESCENSAERPYKIKQ